MDKNLQRNNVARQVEGFCISYFAAFRDGRISAAPVRDRNRISAALVRDGRRIFVTPVKAGHRISTALVRDGCRISPAPLRDGGRIFAASVTFQVLWRIYFKRIGQLANHYCTVLHIVSFVLFFSELAKRPRESMDFLKFIIYSVKTDMKTLSKPILEKHKIVWKAF